MERQRLLNMLRLKTKDKALVEKICREVEFPTDTGYFAAVIWAKKEGTPGQLEPLVFDTWKKQGYRFFSLL